MFDTICMSGGGLKTASFIGALKALVKYKIIDMENIKTYIAVSGGALMSFLFVLGYSLDETIKEIYKADSSILKPKIDSSLFLSKCGIEKGDNFIEFFKIYIRKKLNRNDVTLKELYEITGKKLIVAVTNYTKGKPEYISYETDPELNLTKALRMTCSIPFYFTPVLYNDNYYVDGGLLDNFPMEQGNQKTTIGFSVIREKDTYEIKNLLNYAQDLYTIVYRNLIEKYNEGHVINVRIDNVALTDFNLSEEEITKIFKTGFHQTSEIIKEKYESHFVVKEILDTILTQDVFDKIENNEKTNNN